MNVSIAYDVLKRYEEAVKEFNKADYDLLEQKAIDVTHYDLLEQKAIDMEYQFCKMLEDEFNFDVDLAVEIFSLHRCTNTELVNFWKMKIETIMIASCFKKPIGILENIVKQFNKMDKTK
jgi:hypothetical protein